MRERFLQAKIRNLVYYKSIDTRERTQYMHILRKIRSELIEVTKFCNDERYIRSLDIIPKDVDNDAVDFVCEELRNIWKIQLN